MAVATYKQQAHLSGTQHLGPCRGTWLCSLVRTISRVKKGKQVVSSAKWGLGENVALQLMNI